MSAPASVLSRQPTNTIHSLARKSRYDQSIATMFSDRPCIPFFDLKRFFTTATPRMFDAAVRANKLDIELDWTDLSRACNDNLFMYVLGKYDWLLPRALLDCWLDPAIGPLGYRRARFRDLINHMLSGAMRTFNLVDMERVLRETTKHCIDDDDLIIETAAAVCTALEYVERDNVIYPERYEGCLILKEEMLYILMKKQKYRVYHAVLFVGLYSTRLDPPSARGFKMGSVIIERASRIAPAVHALKMAAAISERASRTGQ